MLAGLGVFGIIKALCAYCGFTLRYDPLPDDRRK